MSGLLDTETSIIQSIVTNVLNDIPDLTNMIPPAVQASLISTLPPVSPLNFPNGQPPAGVIPNQGDFVANSYDGGNQYNPQNGALGTFAPIASRSPSQLKYLDVFAIADWLRNVSQELGIIGGRPNFDRTEAVVKGTTFLASQFLLASFNPGDPNVGGIANQLYNPLSLALSAVPFTRGLSSIGSPNAAAALSIDGTVYSTAAQIAGDRLLMLRDGTYSKAIDATALSKLSPPPPLGFLGDIASQSPGDLYDRQKAGVVSIQGQVDQDGPSAILAAAQNIHKNIYTPGTPYSDGPAYPLDQLQKDFSKNPLLGPSPETLQLRALFAATSLNQSNTNYTWIAKAATAERSFTLNPASWPADYDANFLYEDYQSLIKESDAKDISDDQMYMPFTFQDLRQTPVKYLYFRAFLKDGLSENFSPDWQSERFYGRVDEVPVYLGTVRNVNLAFDVVAFTPRDLPVVWQKLHKLQSMVYPTFDMSGFMQAGPMIRMRVGDLLCAGKDKTSKIKNGLPGYINSLDFSYDDGIWNLDTDFKVPRKVTVSLGFTVVHDGNPGIYPFAANSIDSNGIGTVPITPYNGADSLFGTMTTDIDDQGNISLIVQENNIRGVIDAANNAVLNPDATPSS